jgi:hypothetical protein
MVPVLPEPLQELLVQPERLARLLLPALLVSWFLLALALARYSFLLVPRAQ